MANLRYALRALSRTPGFTVTVVLTLALGIGANSAVFSAIDAVLLRPLPYPESDRLVRLDQGGPKRPSPYIAPSRLADWDRMNSAFDAITGYYTQDESESSGELPERLKRAFVAPRFLEVLGVAPALGHDFRPGEERFGGPNAVLISDRFWRRRFGAAPGALGTRLRIGGSSSEIVGVMPPSFAFPDRDVDLWSPVFMDAPYAQDRRETWFTGIARLRYGISADQASANMNSVQSNLGVQFPATDKDLRVAIQPLKDVMVSGVRRSLWILFGAVSMLLLIACSNIAALLLARAAHREQETAVRYSLGASRMRIALEVLAEALVLALAGAAAGLLLAGAASRAFRALAANLPRVDEIRLDWRIVAYSLTCVVVVTLLCGLLPAIRGSKRALSGSLARAGRSQVSARRPLQYALVGVQVALAVTLLTGAGLLLRSFQEIGRVSPGYDPSHVLTFQITFGFGETGDMRGLRQRTDRILETIRAVPGVEAAAIAIGVPGGPMLYPMEGVEVVERPAENDAKTIAGRRAVSAGYFQAMGIPFLAGESCRETGSGGPSVVVNRSFANAYLGGGGLGYHLRTPAYPNAVPAEIVGIVGDARENGIDRAPLATVYHCYPVAQPGTYFVARTHGAPMSMADTLRRKIHEIEPLRSVFDMMSLEQHTSDSLAENRLRTVLLTFFAATAVALACVGLFGMLSYVVNLRRREVGLRIALGAERGEILARFLLRGLAISAAGCVAGLGLTLAFSRVLAQMLYGISAFDPPTVSGVVAMILLVAGGASFWPALRAARVEPMQVLRDQ